jgi:glycosyltransferase involved in cell wall biosynthesis
MTRIGWLADKGPTVGGAELTQAEFRAAVPDAIEIVDCPPGEVRDDCDIYVIHNCVLYEPADFEVIGTRFAVKYHHDVGPHVRPEVKDWLRENTIEVCCSPIQAEYMGLAAACIPPPVDLQRFRDAAETVNGDRRGAVSVGSWRNYGKAPHRAAEWAAGNGGIDFYGDGPFAPRGSQAVPYEQMPTLLAHYETFVFLPAVIEPFGRLVAEAWAAGCEVVTNNLVGARWWIENDPDALETASEAFWGVVLR